MQVRPNAKLCPAESSEVPWNGFMNRASHWKVSTSAQPWFWTKNDAKEARFHFSTKNFVDTWHVAEGLLFTRTSKLTDKWKWRPNTSCLQYFYALTVPRTEIWVTVLEREPRNWGAKTRCVRLQTFRKSEYDFNWWWYRHEHFGAISFRFVLYCPKMNLCANRYKIAHYEPT